MIPARYGRVRTPGKEPLSIHPVDSTAILNSLPAFFGHQHGCQHISNFDPAVIDALVAWAKEWQPLLGGLLVLLASCIFAVSSLKAARIRAAAPPQTPAKKPDGLETDLRYVHAPAPRPDQANSQPVDMIRSLEHLRSLVRSALSVLTYSEGAGPAAVGACRPSCERIIGLRLEKSALPPNTPKAAYELLDSLQQHIESLGKLLGKKARASDVSGVLVKVNTAARTLTDLLAQPSAAQTTLRFPARKRQQPAGQ